MLNNKISKEETQDIFRSYMNINPIISEDILEALELTYQKQLISSEEYHSILAEIKQEIASRGKYDGKLTTEEQKTLEDAKVSAKDINKIKAYLKKYKDHLTSLNDLVGDTGVPSKLFYFNMDHFGYLLDDNPENVINEKNVHIRQKYFDPIIKTLGPHFLHSPQVFENRYDLLLERDSNGEVIKEQSSEVLDLLKGKINPDTNEVLPDQGITVPSEPVIWVANHHFKDDVLATYLATKRACYILFGSMPQFYNTIDGIMAYMVGSYMTNRKVKSSRHASVDKSVRGYNLGIDTMCFPEAVWNKYPNELIIPIFSGTYKIANETGEKVIPICHYIFDPTESLPKKLNPIHTVIDEPIDLTKFSEKAGVEYLRDVLASWYYLMMEKYGRTTKEELMKWYTEKAIKYNPSISKEELLKRPLTSHEAWELHMIMMRETVECYDKEIETSAHFQPREIVRPENAWEAIANIKHSNPNNVNDCVYAASLVRQRKLENYQKRF